MRVVRRGVAGAAVVALLLTGCSGGGDSDDAGAKAEPGASASGKGGESGAGVESFDAGKALVEQTVPVPERPGDEVTLGVLSLEVKDRVMLLRLAVTPMFASRSDDDVISQFSSTDQTTFRPRLVDVENLKEYSVIKGDDGRDWASSDLNNKARNGTPMLAYAYFAAPEDDIEEIDVRVTDFWPTFTDVPITR